MRESRIIRPATLGLSGSANSLQFRSAFSGFESVGAPTRRSPRTDAPNSFHVEIIISLLSALEARDAYTHQHSIHVSTIAEALAEAMGLSGAQVRTIFTAALLHDIGKIGIPDAVLLKPGRLTADEFEVMKRHSEIGAAMLRPLSFLAAEAELVLHHHEWFDGTGYPHRLSGESIPLGSRILQVADSIDAMMSPRSYKQGYSVDHVLGELRKGRGRQFDPTIAETAIQWMQRHPERLGVSV